MATIKSWISAARPRTLPLALSGIIMGCGLSWFYGDIRLDVSLLAVITATLIQIFSNFANDYGDSQQGADNIYRIGPKRAVQSGAISIKEIKNGMIATGTICLITGILLVFISTWNNSKTAFFLFIGLGILSLLSGYFYTAGKKPYGYIGLGDIFVFLFFGLLPVIGAFYLNTTYLNAEIILPAIAMGMFSTGVLNLNNMRDINNDKNSGKITIPVRIGTKKSRYYHLAIITTGWIAIILFTVINFNNPWQLIYLLTLPVFIIDTKKIVTTNDDRKLDPFLKRLSLTTLSFTLLFCSGLIISLL